MDNITKRSPINTFNDFLDFNLSIKHILVFGFFFGIIMLFLIICLVGGIKNAKEFIKNMIDSTKINLKKIYKKNK
jgi:hypothetical protein